jgi:hypothetical protein
MSSSDDTSPPEVGQETPPSHTAGVVCSAKGCRAEACWVLAWNNPKLHTPDRRKTWVACDQHRGDLADFLAARSFLREVVPLADWDGAR